MRRTPEPELMEGAEQSAAYAQADFAEVNADFVSALLARFPELKDGVVVDLGCGPADICIRLAQERPRLRIHGLDASEEMLSHGQTALEGSPQQPQVSLHKRYLPLPARHGFGEVDFVMSNSLLHHLEAPETLWQTARQLGRDGAGIYIMDLARPDSDATAKALVDLYAANEPAVLRHDFYHSLHAAYRISEVEEQLIRSGLHDVRVSMISDRHWCASGVLSRA